MFPSPYQLKNPIVLVHGLGSYSKYGPVDYFFGITDWLREWGNIVYVADLSFWHGNEVRAKQLEQQLAKAFPNHEAINLIGHSMGGTTVRYYTSQIDKGGQVASVTTIGSPNKGSSAADMALKLVSKKAFDFSDKLIQKIKMSHDGLREVGKNFHDNQFKGLIADIEGVGYFSATSVIQSPVRKHALPQFWTTHPVLYRFEGDNDGFVSEQSAKWGTHITTEFGDHYAQIGQLLGQTRGMKTMNFWKKIIKRLRSEGF